MKLAPAVTEKKLSQLIAELAEWLESEQSEFFVYKGANLRGAFERYIYFESMSRPYALNPLLKLTKAWRDATPDSELTETYDAYWQTASEFSFLKKWIVACIPWVRITRDILSSFTSLISAKVKQRPEQAQIGFFAINARFVDFFQPFVTEFQPSSCTFFSSHPALVAEKVKSHGVRLASLPAPKLFIKDLNLPVCHPLFSVYYFLCIFYRRAYLILEQHRPKVLLFAEGTSHYDDLMARAAKQLKVPTIRVQSGRAGVLHNGYRNMYFDVMLCWSSDFVERYQSVSPKPAYHVTGSPLLDEVHQLREQAVTRIQSNRVVIFTQPMSMHISEQEYLALIEFAKDVLKRDVHTELIVRKHPVDKHQGFEQLQQHYSDRLKLMNAPEYLLAETLAYSDCAVGFFSTTLSEAAACGVVPVILQTNKQQSVYPFPEKHGAAIVVHTAQEAMEKVIEVMEQPEHFEQLKTRMQTFSLRFFGPSDGKSRKRMLDLIKQYAGESAHAE